MESELLQLEVKRVLYKLTIEQLIKVCNALQMSGPEEEHVTGKTRSQVISHVVKYLEREELAGLEDEVQSSEAPVEKKSTTSQSPATLPPELLAEIKEMRSDIVQLKDLKAEICQNRETIQRPTPIPPQYHPPTREPTTVPTPYPLCSPPQSSPYNTESNEMPFYHQQSPTAVQEYRSAFGPGQMRETVQFQQRFAPQRFYPARRPQPRCLSCTQAGEEYCQHCFRCGSTEHFRAGCKEEKESEELKCCSVCNTTLYCSKECQRNHWPTHKRLCKPYTCSGIKKQATQSRDKVKRKENGAPEKTPTVSELVGKKCVIRCFLNKQKTQALWDTGSQICAIDEVWKKSHLPDVPLRDVSELVDPLDPLQIEAANGTEMPYVGWLEVTAGDDPLLIPMLVLKGKQQQCPIIGFNVIERLVLDTLQNQTKHVDKNNLVEAVRMAFPHLRKNKAKTFINAVSIGQTCDHDVKTVNERVSVPKRTSIQIECQVQASPFREDNTLIFEPDKNPRWPEGLEFCDTLVSVKAGMTPKIIVSVQNPTSHDIMLSGRTVIGTVQSARSVYPANAFKTDSLPTASIHHVQAQDSNESTPTQARWDPPAEFHPSIHLLPLIRGRVAGVAV
ncbi:uncharacterized protein LOC106567938 [Tachysurus ichikawai]